MPSVRLCGLSFVSVREICSFELVFVHVDIKQIVVVGDAVQLITVDGHEIKLIEPVAIANEGVDVGHTPFEYHEIRIPVIDNEIEDCILVYDFRKMPIGILHIAIDPHGHILETQP